MKKNKIIIILLIAAKTNVFSQEQGKIKFTALFQSILSIENGASQAGFGKTEVGVWIKPYVFLKIRMIGKLYNDFSIKPFDLYAAFTPLKNLELKIGQFRSPFCYENTLAPFDRIFIDEALTTKLLPTRDIGVGCDYNYNNLEFNVALFNGEGKNHNDINTKKDVVARVALSLPGAIVIGVSYYKGCSGPDSLLHHYNLYNLHLFRIKKQQFSFISEVSCLDNRTTAETTGYIAGGYKFKLSKNNLFLEPLIRAEFIKNYLSLCKYYSTIGFNFHFDNENTLRIQANLKTELTSIQNSNLSLSIFYALK